MHFVDMDVYDYKVFKSLTQPLLCDYVTAFRDSKLPVLVQEAFRRLLSTSLVVKNIYFHATRTQEVEIIIYFQRQQEKPTSSSHDSSILKS